MFEIKDRCLTHYIGGSGARIVLPKEIDSIGSHAFADCLTLEEVHIPGNVTTISEGAFSGCVNLKRVILVEGVKRIRKDCFRDCSSLETVLLPESLTSIQNDAFAGCSALQSIRLSWGLTAIAAGAFRSCTGLTSVTIPAQVKLILSEAFAGCSGLRTVVFESAQTKLNGDSFAECFALDSACMFDIAGRIDKPLKVAVHAKSDGYGGRFTTFAEHRFTFDGVECRSLESVLQSFRFADCNEQIRICSLDPWQARQEGKQNDWTLTETLYWQGTSYSRLKPEYQELLDRLFQQMFEQDAVFRLDCLLLRKGEITLPKWTKNPRLTVLNAKEYRLRLEALSRMEPGQVLHTDLKAGNSWVEESENIHEDDSCKVVVMGGSLNSDLAFQLKQRKPAMLHPTEWKELTDMRWLQDNAIRSFREEYDYLSNFYPAPVEYKGLWYLNNEAAFQAQKCMTEEEKQAFTQLEPSKAKRLGRQVPLRPDWEEVKVEIMAEIVRAKFTQNPWLASRLVATGDREIIEGNTWGDTCWGVDTRTGKGKNHLGKILMELRDQLRKEGI